MTDCTIPDTLFDHLLNEIEAGRDTEALLLLAGMLDAAETNAERGQAFRAALLSHPLHHFLQSLSARDGALARLGFERGRLARVALGALAVEAAWKRGKRILAYRCGDEGELFGLAGQSLDNVEIERAGDPSRTTRYDLILATNFADQLPLAQLSNQMALLRERLRIGGVLLISSFVPGHLGQGLRQVCERVVLHCHDEADLARAANHAGFNLSTFRDASNSLIWGELRVESKIRRQTGDTA